MYSNQFIRKITAAVMLLLFAISVTPKQLFHDVITGHRHSFSKADGKLNFQNSRANFLCNWHNDAIESPFTQQPGISLFSPLPAYSLYNSDKPTEFYSAELIFSTLRGPPSLM